MAALEFKIRRLETGEVLVAEFPDAASARQWLAERPPFVEVIRLITMLEPQLEAELRSAMRPLDPAERTKQIELENARAAKRREQDADAEGGGEAADPDRAMVVRWESAKGMWLPEDDDDREIPKQVEQAVHAWIAERNTWVRDRGEHVCAAVVTAWPGSVPSGRESERIQPGGQFVTMEGSPPGD